MEKLLLELFVNITYNKRLNRVRSRNRSVLTETQLERELHFTVAHEQSLRTAEYRLPFALCTLHNEMQYVIVKMKSLYILHKTERTGFILHLNTT